jgi:hypothetical protein
MENVDYLKKAQFTVDISGDGLNIKMENASYDSAFAVVKALAESHPDNENLQRAWNGGRGFGFSGFSSGKFRYTVSAGLPTTPMPDQEGFWCPRRLETGQVPGGVFKGAEEKDKWEKRGDDPCCSYCGSIKPSRVFDLVREHGFGIIGSTDKGYKYYLTRPNVPNASFGGIKFYLQHFSQDDINEYNTLLTNFKKSLQKEEAAIRDKPQA